MRLLVSRHLENFLAIYTARNMHIAAERKGISQPALTKSLRLLEADLNASLFDRTPKGLEPTDAGDMLYRYARSIEQEARFAALDINQNYGELKSAVRLGVGQALAMSIFPSVIVDLRRQFPGVEIVVETGIANRLMESLVRDNLDIVIFAQSDDPLPERYVQFPLFSSEMVVVCRKDHPLRNKGSVSLSDLSAYDRVGHIEDRDFDRRFSRISGLERNPTPVVETASMSIMFGVMAVTDSYAIVSSMILPRAEREGLARLVIDQPLWDLEIELICKAALAGSRMVATIKTLLIEKAP